MLVAEHEGRRVEAAGAPRGVDYVCPQCKGALVYKPGRRVVSHFAHKPPTDCTWATGETRAHLEAKQLFRDVMAARGYAAELERVVDTLPGDRRADVMVWSPTGQCLAVELQHTSIGPDEIEARAFAYARANIAQIWIPFLSAAVLASAEPKGMRTYLVKRYTARPFERWIHGLGGGDGMWMYGDRKFWHAALAPHQIYKEQSSWFEAGGVERTEGGYYYPSKRYRELTLTGPHTLENLDLTTKHRRALSLNVYNWPAATIAQFSVRPPT